MAILQTILTVSSDDEDDAIYDAINEILTRGMPNARGWRAWTEFVINRLANDAVITCTRTDEYDIDQRRLGGKWEEAYEILCQHVTAAAAAIRVLSLEKKPLVVDHDPGDKFREFNITTVLKDASTSESPTPGNIGVMCPVCGCEFVQLGNMREVDSHDAYAAGWWGRGNLQVVQFWGECEHTFQLCFGFHKGHVSAFGRIPLDENGLFVVDSTEDG